MLAELDRAAGDVGFIPTELHSPARAPQASRVLSFFTPPHPRNSNMANAVNTAANRALASAAS